MVLILAFLVAVAVTPLAGRLARRVGLLDHPGELKIQSEAVPYLGGLGVAAGLAVAVVPTHPSLLITLALALALGVTDDRRHIDPLVRLAAEVVIGISAAVALPTRVPSPVGPVAVVFLVVVLMNGVNMVDGLDGLAAGVALAGAAGFAVVLKGEDGRMALGLVGALAGFLVFNRPPARIYLGDGGAYLVGAALATLVVLAWAPSRPLAVSVGCLPLVACPVAEVGFAVVRRARSGAPLATGDRSHVYDQLVDRGWSRNRSVAAYVLVQVALAAVALAAVHAHPGLGAATVAATAVLLLGGMAALGFLSPTHPETAS